MSKYRLKDAKKSYIKYQYVLSTYTFDLNLKVHKYKRDTFTMHCLLPYYRKN